MTIGTELKEATARIEALEAEVAKAKTDNSETLAAAVAQGEALRVEPEALNKAADEGAVKLAAAESALAAESEAHGKTKEALDVATKALANPAFAGAARQATAATTADNAGEAGGDTAEFETREQAEAAYRKINCGDGMETARAKAAFREKHKTLLGL